MKTIAIQVVPYSEEEPGQPTAQFAGPDANTAGWAIYKRKENGTVEHYIDADTEDKAWDIGCMLSEKLGVAVEPQPWKLVSPSTAYRATVEIELTTTSLERAKHMLAERLGSVIGDGEGAGIDDYRVLSVKQV